MPGLNCFLTKCEDLGGNGRLHCRILEKFLNVCTPNWSIVESDSYCPYRFSRGRPLSGGAQTFLSPFEIQMLFSTDKFKLQMIERSLWVFKLKLAQCSDFKMPKSILDNRIIYFEQKIFLSLTNLRFHPLNILKSISPMAPAFFSPQNSCRLLLSIGDRKAP